MNESEFIAFLAKISTASIQHIFRRELKRNIFLNHILRDGIFVLNSLLHSELEVGRLGKRVEFMQKRVWLIFYCVYV